jgi:hypothetical protein
MVINQNYVNINGLFLFMALSRVLVAIDEAWIGNQIY